MLIEFGQHDGAKVTKPGAWPFSYFSPFELRQRDTGEVAVDLEFVTMLDALRAAFGAPLVVSSYYRSPEYNAQVSTTGADGPHTTGRAVDFQISGRAAYRLLEVARRPEFGFTGIGIKQKGPHAGRFIHLDDLPDAANRPRPWVWSY